MSPISVGCVATLIMGSEWAQRVTEQDNLILKES